MSWMQKRAVARRIGAVVLATGALVGVTATQAQARTTTYTGVERTGERKTRMADAWSDAYGLARRCRGAVSVHPFVIDSPPTAQGGVNCVY
jgi:hypothetical protein